MAFIFCDSFDHYTTAQVGRKYPQGIGMTIASGGRRGSSKLTIGTNSTSTPLLVSPANAGFVAGFAFAASASSGYRYICGIYDGTSAQVTFTYNGVGAIQAWRGAQTALLGESANGVFDFVNGWHHLEFKGVINNTTGSIVIRCNETTVLTLSNQDTQATANQSWGRFYYLNSTGTLNSYDDFYLLDTSGASLNDFLGDVRVDCHRPDANGANNGSTPSTGTDRYATIDEATPNDDTDYNSVTTIGNKDTVSVESLINSGNTPHAAQLVIASKKIDDGIGTWCPVARQDSTDYDGASQGAPQGSYDYKIHPMGTAPDGTAWTEAKFNACEFGYKRNA